MVECVAFGDLFAQMGNYLSNFLFFLLNSLHFLRFFILLLNIITCMKDLFGLFFACYLL